jgi:hypothetical protein
MVRIRPAILTMPVGSSASLPPIADFARLSGKQNLQSVSNCQSYLSDINQSTKIYWTCAVAFLTVVNVLMN